jgi:hypothetical protein
MPHPLDGARTKIKRAKEHICDLEARLTSFKNGNPYGVVPELNSDTGKRVFRFRANQSIPDEISLRAAEAIQNLRTALDYAVWALICTGATPGRHTGFPIYRSAKEYKAQSPGKVNGLCQFHIDAIDLTKPYKGGTDALWQLHELNNIDKHRLLLTAGIAYRVITQQRFPAPVMISAAGVGRVVLPSPIVNVDSTPPDAVFPVIDGAEILALPAEANMNPQFTFDVAFNEPGIIERQPILPFLHQLSQLVGGIIESFV